MKTRQNYS